MTDKQKNAIKVLNSIQDKITEDEYFLLMDFIIQEHVRTEYYPWIYPQTEPYKPWTTWPDTPNPWVSGPIYTTTSTTFDNTSVTTNKEGEQYCHQNAAK